MRPIFLPQARQEMPPATSFSMALLCACNKVWLAKCNELQIRRLYLRVVRLALPWPPWRRSRPQRAYSTTALRALPRSFQDCLSVVSLFASFREARDRHLTTSATFPKIARGRSSSSTSFPSTVCQRPVVGPPFHVHTRLACSSDLKTPVLLYVPSSSGTSPPKKLPYCHTPLVHLDQVNQLMVYRLSCLTLAF
jgi:hypothetical protein